MSTTTTELPTELWVAIGHLDNGIRTLYRPTRAAALSAGEVLAQAGAVQVLVARVTDYSGEP